MTLTQEEKNVLDALKHGSTVKEISAVLGITEYRVREIKKSFISKLDAKNHTEAVYLALRDRLIEY